MQEIIAATERKQHTAGVFIDFENAFYTIDHCLILSKLQPCGIWGTSVKEVI